MSALNFKILYPEESCNERSDKNLNCPAPAGSYFSSPCFLSEFDEEEAPF
jgi:hypothetical protein